LRHTVIGFEYQQQQPLFQKKNQSVLEVGRLKVTTK
jgi:hypothetical protein